MTRHFPELFLLCFAFCVSAFAGGPKQLVLLDRSDIRVEDVVLEKGMLNCTLKDGKKLILSCGLIDWEFTKRSAPDIYALACPESGSLPVDAMLSRPSLCSSFSA